MITGNYSDIACLPETGPERLAELARQEGVAPLLYHALSGTTHWQTLPPVFRDRLAYLTRNNAAWDLLRQSDLGELIGHLNDAGVPFLLFKGAGLAYTHYEQSYFRDRCDTDLLFPDQAAFETGWQVLKTMGYSRRNTLSGEFVGYQQSCFRPLGEDVHQVLDCHVRINDYVFYADAFDFEELRQQSVPIPALADAAYTLGKTHALLVACMHRVATIPLGGADRLIWLYDIYLLGRSFNTADWDNFLHQARIKSLCGTCVNSLRAAMAFFPVPVPEALLQQLEQGAAEEPFKPGMGMKRWRFYLAVFRSVPGIGKKTRLLREHFFPRPAYLMEKYGTRSWIKLPFLYVHRIFSGWKRYF